MVEMDQGLLVEKENIHFVEEVVFCCVPWIRWHKEGHSEEEGCLG